MEGKIEDTTTCLQNENVVPVSQKKKSGIPVLVKKGAQTHRAVLATVSEFQQNVLQNNIKHKPVQTWPTVRSSDLQKGCKGITRKASSSLFDKDCKSAVKSLSTDLHIRAVQKTPKTSAAVCACPVSESSSQTPRSVPDKLVSLVEEQQQSGIEFQRDSNALKSILTNAGIAMSASGTVSEMFRPQRATEGQGRPVYTPAKHAALMRNSVYTKEPRMSLIDSCNQYKKFLRQTRGVGEQSESASPVLARSPPKTAVCESPLVKGMKPSTVRGSVYPKWSQPALFSPFTEQRSSSYVEPSKQTNVTDHAEDGKEKLGTPKTPVMTFRRVPVTPLSSRQRAYAGFVAGTPGTPSSAYSRVPITPARRVPIQTSSKTDIKTEPIANPVQGSIKKKLRWADILSACSPDPQHAEQTARVPASSSMNNLDSSSTHYVCRQDFQSREPASHRLTSAPVERSSSLSTTCSATDHNDMGNSSLVPLQATLPSLHAQQNLPCSMGLRDFSEPLHPVQEGDEGDSQLDEVVERHKQKAVACDSMKSAAAWSSVHAQKSDVVAKTCDRSTASASQTDILARLQVLEEREHGIQNEIQLLRMAMKKRQEADGNDDGISHPGPYPGQFSHSSTDQTNKSVINQISSSGDGAMSTLNIGLQATCFDFPQTSLFDYKSVSLPPKVLSTSAIHTSKCLTSDSQGYAASSRICSESSYNTALNVRTICMKTADLKYPENVSRGTVVLNPDAGGACSDIWLTGNTATRLLENKDFLSSNEVTCGDRVDGNVLDFDDNDCENLRVLSAEDEVKIQQLTTDTMSSSTSDSPDASTHNMEYEDTFTKKVGGAFRPLCPPVDDVKVCETQFHIEQQEHDSQIKPVSSERNSTQANTGLFHNHQGPISQTKMRQKQSLDMDVEEIEDEAVESHEESSLAARDQDMECSLDTRPETLHGWPTRFNPVSTIVHPRVQPSSPHANQQATTTMQISPPIWTTLALKSAANYNSLQASVDMEHQQVTATSEAHTSQDAVTLPPSKEVMKKSTDVTARGDGSGSVSPGFRVNASPTKRSPLHSTLRSRHGRMTSSALKNADLFLEALVEDECALYAGRLHSFFRNPMVVCDRQETPDPVAKVLTEGDDMHFLPVAGDSALIDHRSATPFENSAFFSYVPV